MLSSKAVKINYNFANKNFDVKVDDLCFINYSKKTGLVVCVISFMIKFLSTKIVQLSHDS